LMNTSGEMIDILPGTCCRKLCFIASSAAGAAPPRVRDARGRSPRR
jgi:hypothetical protein